MEYTSHTHLATLHFRWLKFTNHKIYIILNKIEGYDKMKINYHEYQFVISIQTILCRDMPMSKKSCQPKALFHLPRRWLENG